MRNAAAVDVSRGRRNGYPFGNPLRRLLPAAVLVLAWGGTRMAVQWCSHKSAFCHVNYQDSMRCLGVVEHNVFKLTLACEVNMFWHCFLPENVHAYQGPAESHSTHPRFRVAVGGGAASEGGIPRWRCGV